MRKFFAVACTTLASVILIFAIVFTTLEAVVSDEIYINNEFTKLSVGNAMGMSNTDLVNSTLRLVQYMKGEAEDIHIEVTVNGEPREMFEMDQEVQHMKDVRDLYLSIKRYRDTGVLVMLLLFLLGSVIHFKKAPRMLAQGYLSGTFIMLLFFGFIGTWAAMDFSAFWTFFHQTLFTNDLWLFDSSESRMINMLPEQFFSDITGRIFLYAGILMVLLMVLSVVAIVVTSDRYKQKQALRESRKRAREAARRARKKQMAEAKAAAEKAKRAAEKQKRRAEMEKRRAEAAARGGKNGAEKKAGGHTAHRKKTPAEASSPYEDEHPLMAGAVQAAAIPMEPEPEPEPEPTEEEKLQRIAEQAILKAKGGIHLDGIPEAEPAAPTAPAEAPREPTEEELLLQRAAEKAILRASGVSPEERITTGRQKKRALPEEEHPQEGPVDLPAREKAPARPGVKEKRIGRITFEFVQPDRKKSTIRKKKPPFDGELPARDEERQEAFAGEDGLSEAPARERKPKAKKPVSSLFSPKTAKQGKRAGRKKRDRIEDDTGFFDD